MTSIRPGLLVLALAAPGVPAAEVTIYRCTDAQGELTLRDTPCRKGERQQTREMLRPVDPPPHRAVVRSAPAVAPATPAPARVVVVTPPRPLYECVTPDGARYTSDSDAGNPRWVPLWTLGYPVWPSFRPAPGGVHARVGGRVGDHARVDVRVGDPAHRPPRPVVIAQPAGTWVQVRCHALPPAEVCARLRDERHALGRRYHSALQSERARITVEERGIDARLASECGGS